MSDTLTRAKKLFDLGGHLGHRKSRLHPKARPFIYEIIDGTSVIDLEQTIGQIDAAKKAIAESARNGESVLVVATKKAISSHIMKTSKDANVHYITAKWLPGLLTNFDTIVKNVRKMTQLKKQKETGEWSKFVKHEQVALEKQVRKLERLYTGVETMTRLPNILVVIDIKREKNSITEAKKNNIPVIAIVDTNCDPNDVSFPIILNDDAPEAVFATFDELIAEHTANAPKPEMKVVKSDNQLPPVKNEEVKTNASGNANDQKVVSKSEPKSESDELEIKPIEDNSKSLKKIIKVAKPAKKASKSKKKR